MVCNIAFMTYTYKKQLYVFIYTHTCLHTYTYRTHTHDTYPHIRPHTHIYVHIYRSSTPPACSPVLNALYNINSSALSFKINVDTFDNFNFSSTFCNGRVVGMCIHTHICTVYTCISRCIYIHINAHTCAHTYTYTYT